MCGIFGAINLDSFFNNQDYKRFVELTDLITYRGPDGSGYLALNVKDQASASQQKFDIFLGHRRLSIIDLSAAGKQPMTDGTGIWIVHNGEIFNYIELRKELLEKGYHFHTQTDTEVILKIYQEYGEAGFQYLNGMWSFAVVDLAKRKVVLSRDRFSIKPLYHTKNGNRIYFASEIKQLLPLLSKKEVNAKIIHTFLKQALVDHTEETFFNRLNQVQPRHNLSIHFHNRSFKEKKYWEYSLEETVPEAQLIEKFRELLINSVRIRLRSDVKLGCLLSGGLDSSTLAVIINKLLETDCPNYSVISDQKDYSEEKYVDILSRQCNIENHKLNFKADYVVDKIEEVVYHNDEPFGGLCVIALYQILADIKSKTDIKVVLNGQGADETLLGYRKFFFFYLQQLVRKGHLINFLWELISSIIQRTIIKQFHLGDAKRYMSFYEKKEGESFLRFSNKLEYEPLWECHDINKRQILDIDRYSVPNITHYEDRVSMANSIEIRLPYLDHRLVNFSINLAINKKIKSGWTKYILRKAFPELPSRIRWRRDKQGFLNPEALWLKGELRSYVHHIFHRSMLQEMGILDDQLFLQYYEKYQKNNKLVWPNDIIRAVTAEIWARKFLG